MLIKPQEHIAAIATSMKVDPAKLIRLPSPAKQHSFLWYTIHKGLDIASQYKYKQFYISSHFYFITMSSPMAFSWPHQTVIKNILNINICGIFNFFFEFTKFALAILPSSSTYLTVVSRYLCQIKHFILNKLKLEQLLQMVEIVYQDKCSVRQTWCILQARMTWNLFKH